MRATEKLFMVLLGCRPEGRLTEQHDVFFGIGTNLKTLIPQMNKFWPQSGGLHIDAWREVNSVNGFDVTVAKRTQSAYLQKEHLFFINLGGYKADDFEEYHYKILTVASDLATAIKSSKSSAFYKHTGIPAPGGKSHIDDKYGIDVDDVMKVEDILSDNLKSKFAIALKKQKKPFSDDKLHIGYIKLSKLK